MSVAVGVGGARRNVGAALAIDGRLVAVYRTRFFGHTFTLRGMT